MYTHQYTCKSCGKKFDAREGAKLCPFCGSTELDVWEIVGWDEDYEDEW